MRISRGSLFSLIAVVAIFSVPAHAYKPGIYDPEMHLTAEVHLDDSSYPKEIWEKKPIKATCSWGIEVVRGSFSTNPLKGSVYIKGMTAVMFSVDGDENLDWTMYQGASKLPPQLIIATKLNAIPEGVHGQGKVFGGQLVGSFLPTKPGRAGIGCSIFIVDPTFSKFVTGSLTQTPEQNGHATSWSYGGVSKPKPFTPEELPVPEVVAPLKAPGGEIIKLSLDASHLRLAARIPPTTFTSPAKEHLVPDKCTEAYPPKSFWQWATDCTFVFEERWHLQLLKRQASGMFLPVDAFSGLVTKQEYEALVTPAFFSAEKHGGGVWRLKTWLTQEKTPQGVVSGKTSAVDFEVNLLPKGPLVANPSAALLAAVAKPSLSVAGVQVKIEPNCQAGQPAMTAIVTIMNTGGALPAKKGTVVLKEQGGGNLGSASVVLPAIGSGQTQPLNIPASTQQPYSSLAGAHQVQVILNPQSEGGQLSFNKPPAPYVFSAAFPPGHCKSTRSQPVPNRF